MGELVDWHIHAFRESHRTDEDRALQSLRNVLGDGKADPELLSEAVDEAGVARFIVVALPKHAGNHTPSTFIADVVRRHPGRAVGFCSVHPDDADAGDDFESALALGLRGLKLSPTYQAMDPRSPACGRLYEIACHHDVPVMFHCGGAYTGSLEFADPCLLDRVAMDFPHLKIIVAHFGQPYMEQTAILMRKNDNIFADLSARYHRPWQLYNGLMIAREYGVTGRLLFGSDFPVRRPSVAIAEFRAINRWGEGLVMPRIPDALIEEILHERPLDLLGIAPR